MNNAAKILNRHVFSFNPKDNGGESLTLTTEFIDNGDGNGKFFTNQSLNLQSYSNSATLSLYSACFTPENLRKLADELENINTSLNGKQK